MRRTMGVALAVILLAASVASAEGTFFLIKPGATLEQVLKTVPDIPINHWSGGFYRDDNPCSGPAKEIKYQSVVVDPQVTICVTASGKISSYSLWKSTSDFAGGIELYRYMRDARAEILALPGIVVDFNDSTELRVYARKNNVWYIMKQFDRGVLVMWTYGN